MFCMNCGKNIGDQAVCPYCGCPNEVDPPAQQAEVPVPQAQYDQEIPAVNDHPVQNGYTQPQAYAPYREAPAAYGYDTVPAEQPAYPDAPVQPAYGMNEGYTQPADPYAVPFTGDAPEPKKKKKTGLIIGIIVSVVILLAGAGVLVFFLTADARDYSKAMGLKDDGQYQDAIAILTELGDYDDSSEQITDCQYLEAKQMLDNHEFDKAIAAFKALGNYKDSKDMVKECDYQKAIDLSDNWEYEEAREIFESLGDYADSAEKVKACDLAIAKEMIDSDPLEAIEALEELGDEADTKDLIDQAKMSYCKSHKDSSDMTTYTFIKELKAAFYPGASVLYDELYAYSIEEAFWNDDDDNDDPASGVTKLSVKKDQVLHFTLLGGEPDDTSAVLKYTVTWPGGNTGDGQFTDIYKYKYYTITLTNDVAGTVKVDIYSPDDGSVLYSASVTVA